MYGVNAFYGMIYMVVVALSVYGRNSVALFGGLFYCRVCRVVIKSIRRTQSQR